MPTGHPDYHSVHPETIGSTADRMIRRAMEEGEFDDLAGTGEPLPGAGKIDDDMWWVRSWLERSREPNHQTSSNDA